MHQTCLCGTHIAVYSPFLIDLAATMSRQRRGKKRRVNSAPKAIKTRGRALDTVLTDTRWKTFPGKIYSLSARFMHFQLQLTVLFRIFSSTRCVSTYVNRHVQCTCRVTSHITCICKKKKVFPTAKKWAKCI